MNTNNLAINTPTSSRFSSANFPAIQHSKRKRQSDSPPAILYASTVQQMNKHAQLNDEVKSQLTISTSILSRTSRCQWKKDQQIDKLSFVSFRVSCSLDLYVNIFNSSFWPNHVQIDKFFDNLHWIQSRDESQKINKVLTV